MSIPVLQFLNGFFIVFHTVWMGFNCAGWAWRKTRRLHLATTLLTMGSWFILGIWYGWGYCVCTDWHWQIRRALGYRDGNQSYTHLLLLRLTGLDLSPLATDILTGGVFATTTILTIVLNGRDWKRGKA